MHTRRKHECAQFVTCVSKYALYAGVCAQIFTKIFFCMTSLSYDLKFQREQASKISGGLFLPCRINWASDWWIQARAPNSQNSLELRNSGFWLVRALAPEHIQAVNQRPSWLRTTETSLQQLCLPALFHKNRNFCCRNICKTILKFI